MSTERETERIRRIYDRRAPREKDMSDSGLAARAARWLGEQAQGETLEVGVGRGRTLPYYPAGISLTGIELSPVALDLARRRAARLGLAATLVEGDAMDLPFAEASFDTVVFSFVLCTVPDDRRAVAEAVRVLRPGGRLLLAEHVRSPNLAVRLLERAIDPLMVRWQADHMAREPLDHVRAEGLDVEALERRWLGVFELLAARKPA